MFSFWKKGPWQKIFDDDYNDFRKNGINKKYEILRIMSAKHTFIGFWAI